MFVWFIVILKTKYNKTTFYQGCSSGQRNLNYYRSISTCIQQSVLQAPQSLAEREFKCNTQWGPQTFQLFSVCLAERETKTEKELGWLLSSYSRCHGQRSCIYRYLLGNKQGLAVILRRSLNEPNDSCSRGLEEAVIKDWELPKDQSDKSAVVTPVFLSGLPPAQQCHSGQRKDFRICWSN